MKKTCSEYSEFSRQRETAEGEMDVWAEMKEQSIWKRGENAAEQSRSQAAGKDHLGARCVSFCLLSSATEPALSPSPSTPFSSPYSDKAGIQTETQKCFNFHENVLGRRRGVTG